MSILDANGYYSVIIAGAFVAIMTFIPETLPQVVISRAIQRAEAQMTQTINDEKEKVIAQTRVAFIKESLFVLTMTFRILFTEPIVTCLGLFNGYIYGLLFLYLYGIYDVFVVNNNLS